MTFTIGWSQGSATAESADEVDAVLDRIAADPRRRAYLVHIAPADDDRSVMELVWGHPERAMVMYADDDCGGWGFEPALPPLTADLDYDYGSIEPARTRVTAAAARQAVRQYVATRRQPANLSWFDE